MVLPIQVWAPILAELKAKHSWSCGQLPVRAIQKACYQARGACVRGGGGGTGGGGGLHAARQAGARRGRRRQPAPPT